MLLRFVRLEKPYNPSTRFRSVADFRGLSSEGPVKSLTVIKKSRAGRNCSGSITVRGRGGGHKKRYRLISFKRLNSEGKVISLEYDPNRSARIALLRYNNGLKEYIIAPHGIGKGAILSSGPTARFDVGNALPLELLPLGVFVHNVELTIGKGGQLVRAAGTTAKLLAKEGDYVTLRLPSREVRLVHKRCYATVGQVGNIYNKRVSIGKAGRNRWLGKRPKVRGVAKNPVDHPHGGGEGRTGTGRIPKTPWGRPALFVRTRDSRFVRYSKKASSGLIIQRRRRKRRGK